MNTSELLKRVRKIEIKTKGLSNQIFSGEYHSAFKGRGMSFSEVREYQFGDDIKSIDWNVTARFNTPYVKIFEEERELTVMLLVDVSQSAFFGTKKQMKNEMITEICAVLAFSVINNNDKVGVIFFSDKIEKFIPPKKGKPHVLRIIRELLDFSYGQKAQAAEAARQAQVEARKKISWKFWQQPPKPKQATAAKHNNDPTSNSQTNIAGALKYFNNVIKRKSIAFLLSDFMSDGYQQALNIAARKHDLIGIYTYDEREKELPNVGVLRVVDAETGISRWLDTSNKNLRKQYHVNFIKHYRSTKNAFNQSRADLISIPTHHDYVRYLMSFFKKRGAK